jgi:hypothetical protein
LRVFVSHRKLTGNGGDIQRRYSRQHLINTKFAALT